MQYDQRPNYQLATGNVGFNLEQRFREFWERVQRASLEADHQLYKMKSFSSRHILAEHTIRLNQFYAFELRVRIFLAASKGRELTRDLVKELLATKDKSPAETQAGVEEFKRQFFLHRHCDLPSGTVTEKELRKHKYETLKLSPYIVVPRSLHFFTFTDALTSEHNENYLHEMYVVEVDGELKILDMCDDDCIFGGLSTCYIQ